MEGFQQKEMLDSFRVLVDTREQFNERAKRRLNRLGCPYDRIALDCGDYSYNALLPNGKWLFDQNTTVKPFCVVERKMSIDEICGNLTRGRERFEREFDRAKANGAKVHIVIENGSWERIFRHDYKSRMHPNALKASLIAFMVRYDASINFCRDDSSGMLIKEILYRDLKERIERGDFDGKTIDA